MEEILRKLHKDASGHRHKGIRDACVYACGEFALGPGSPLGPVSNSDRVGATTRGRNQSFT